MPTTIGSLLLSHAATDSKSPAIVADGLQTLTFAALGQHIEDTGKLLGEAGLGPGARIGIALPRGPEAALLSVAVCCWATVVPLNPALPAAEFEEELAAVRLDALIVPGWTDIPAWAAAPSAAFGLFQVARAWRSFDDIRLTQVRPGGRRLPAAQPIRPDSIAAIFRTSGTTGTAKRVPVTHDNLLEMADKMQRWLQLSPADRSACIMPIYYNAGFKATLLVPLLIGCSVALPASPGPQDFGQWVTGLRPTWLTAAPAYLQSVLDKLPALGAQAPTHALRFVLSTASYLPDGVRADLQTRLGVPVLEFYGLCEAGMMTAPPVPPAEARPGTVGRIPPGELAIRGDDGSLLPPGKVGQIVLRGRSVMPGYLPDVDGTPAGLVDGWLVTGDLGVVDAEGFLTVVGRTKEIINRGGEKVAPYDVERVLLQHPAVREAAVFAVPHPRLGESVAAAVVLKDDMPATSSDLIGFLQDRLAPFQMPRQVRILASLPKGNTGKISRPQLSVAFATRVREIVRPVEPLQIQIAEIWERILKHADFGIDDDFFDAGGDSLQAAEMLLELEGQTRHTIGPSQIGGELTIRHLASALVSAVAAKDELVTCIKEGDGVPLFLWHGDFDGWGFYALRLSELLDYDGPVYLVHPTFDREAGIDSIEAMGRCYVPRLLAIQPTGAFRLAGYCHGGLVAWEVAHQLELSGRSTESVVLIDTFSINANLAVRGIARAVSAIGELAPAAIGDRLKAEAMPAVWAGTRRLMQKDSAILWRAAKRLYGGQQASGPSMRTTYYHAMANYLPPHLDSDVVCVLCDEYEHKREFSADAWKELARHVVLEHVPGKHNTCITSHVGDLARTLDRHLRRERVL